MELIQLKRDDKWVTVSREDYIKGKTLQLRDFGYPELTTDDVRAQVELVLAGKTEHGEDGFTVIGGFIVDEIKAVE